MHKGYYLFQCLLVYLEVSEGRKKPQDSGQSWGPWKDQTGLLHRGSSGGYLAVEIHTLRNTLI